MSTHKTLLAGVYTAKILLVYEGERVVFLRRICRTLHRHGEERSDVAIQKNLQQQIGGAFPGSRRSTTFRSR